MGLSLATHSPLEAHVARALGIGESLSQAVTAARHGRFIRAQQIPSTPHLHTFIASGGLLGCDVANAHALHPFVCPCIRVCIHTFMIILARSLAFTHPAMKSRASRSANNRGLTDANAAPIRRRVLVAGSWGHSTSLSVITLVIKGCARCGQREFVHHRAVVPPIPILAPQKPAS